MMATTMPRAVRQSNVPVITITAYGDDDTKPKAIEGGEEGLLTKPIDFALLREQVNTRLGRAGRVASCWIS
jgi:DNA-binding response OmpR family regulator